MSIKEIDKDTFQKLLGERVEEIIFPFEAFIEVLAQNSDFLQFFVKIFETGFPNRTHKLIAKLMKEGLVQIVITTNHDNKIEQAFDNIVESKLEPSLNVYWNEEQF